MSAADHRVTDGPWRRGLTLAAPAMAALWLAGPPLATLLYPGFDWTTDTLGAVGRAGQPSAPVFDAALVVGALFGLLFVARLWLTATNRLQRAGLGLVGLLVLAVGAAQLGLGNPWFELVALAFILLLLPALALVGSGDVLAGRPGPGLLGIWLGIAHLLGWQVLAVLLELSSAIPTYLSLGLVSVWAVGRFRYLGGAGSA